MMRFSALLHIYLLLVIANHHADEPIVLSCSIGQTQFSKEIIKPLPSQPRRPRRILIEWAALSASLLVAAVLLIYLTRTTHQQVFQLESERLSTQARVVHDHIVHQLFGTNRALASVRDHFPAWSTTNNGMTLATEQMMILVDAIPLVRTMLILDAEGDVLASTRPEVLGKNFKDRDFYKAPASAPDRDTLYVSPPFRTTIGTWVINVVRMIPDKDGGFGGLVSASLESNELALSLDSVRYTSDMWSGLAHGDGKVFILRPEMGDITGSNVLEDPNSLTSRHLASGQMLSILTGKALTTQTDALMVQHTVQPAALKMDKPLIIALARRSYDMYAPWRADATNHWLLFALCTAFSVPGLLMVQRRRRVSEEEAAEAERALRASEQKLLTILDSVDAFIYLKDTEGRYLFANQAVRNLWQTSIDEIVGHTDASFFDLATAENIRHNDQQVLIEGHVLKTEETNTVIETGLTFTYLSTKLPLRDEDGRIYALCGISTDITAQKDHQHQLEHIAHFDALTGLPNRVLLADRLRQAMVQSARRKQPLGIAYIDLDGFKAINDTHGHDMGDRFLIAIAQRMKTALRETDTLARLGGDEFVAILVDLTEPESIRPLLERLLNSAAEPIHLDQNVLRVSASIGVTLYPQSDDVDADQMLRQADQAMYQAKLGGKNRFHYFDLDKDRSLRGRHESIERIREALENREFVLYYQPKVNMRTGRVIGAEALIRWQHPEQGLLSPVTFLPVIEDHPLSVAVGEWVIETALTQMMEWESRGLSLPVSVNVGARQLQQANFIERLSIMLASHPGLNPASLQLEVLESSALEDIEQVSQLMEACRVLGIGFALDDFGTGYSSLTYLKRLPAKVLKIDQSFVRDMLDDPDDLAILEGVLGLATAFSRESIAEGVETIAHGTVLLQLGCDLAQGYGIARPMPAAALPAWAANWRPDPAWENAERVSPARLPALHAGVEHRAWINYIDDYLHGRREVPPQLDPHLCRFGEWLRQAIDDTADCADATLAEIDAFHAAIHTLGKDLVLRHARGDIAELQHHLDELHSLRDQLNSALARLIQAR
jgi:diguanylate cyclase (GGDEF)-like protein/PAS domain S-box-containing protein